MIPDKNVYKLLVFSMEFCYTSIKNVYKIPFFIM
jgi:hypothetical protein